MKMKIQIEKRKAKPNGFRIVIGKTKGNGFFEYVIGNKKQAQKKADKLKESYKTMTIWGLEGKPNLKITLNPTNVKECSICGDLTDGDYSNYCLKCEDVMRGDY